MEDDKLTHRWANYSGEIQNGRMEGKGTYWYDTETKYEGEFKDGMFHGEGTLYFQDGGKYVTSWSNGRDLGGKFSFKDGLEFDGNDDTLSGWDYANRIIDRRFYQERMEGLRPVDRCMLAAQSKDSGKPVHSIPEGCYDTGDGYYNPASKVVLGYLELPDTEANRFIRNVTDDQHDWIVAHCRSGDDRFVGCQRRVDYSDVIKASKRAGTAAMRKQGMSGRK